MSASNGQQPPQLNLAEPIPIVLSLSGWNMVLQMIAKAPWETADPLMTSIREQIGQAVRRILPPQPPQGPRPVDEAQAAE